jgi:hypothetical protein
LELYSPKNITRNRWASLLHGKGIGEPTRRYKHLSLELIYGHVMFGIGGLTMHEAIWGSTMIQIPSSLA